MWFFSKGLKNEFETAVVKEASVIECLLHSANVCIKKMCNIWIIAKDVNMAVKHGANDISVC